MERGQADVAVQEVVGTQRDLDDEESDAQLVNSAQGGDANAFSRLYERYRTPLRVVVSSYVGAGAAEDVVHDVFVLALRYMATLREPDRFAPWLMQMGRNRCRRWLRENATRRFAAPPVEYLGDWPDNPGYGGFAVLPSDDLENRLDMSALLRALPAMYHVPLTLHYFRDMTVPEIAHALGVSVATVKWRIHRGLELCRLEETRQACANRLIRQKGELT